jgi:Ca-activated chloride channel family protein
MMVDDGELLMFRFADPYFFAAAAAIPAAWFYHRRREIRPCMRISGMSAVADIGGSFFVSVGRLLPLLKYAALCLLIVALARPQWGSQQLSIKSRGINIILAVDLSESMSALDFREKGRIVNRLQAVKSVIGNFISKRSGDRIGMVVFGTHAYTQLPLTRDYSAISSILERLKIGSAGKSTAIGDAIGISLKRLKDIKSKSNVIILLTDGRSNSGELSPGTATEIAVQNNVKIYTVGVGSHGRVPFLIHDPVFGDQYVYQRVDIDEDALKDIARRTGGLYFRAEDTKGLNRIYDTIDRLEKSDVKVNTFDNYKELYPYFLIPSLVLLGGWILLSNTRFLSVP